MNSRLPKISPLIERLPRLWVLCALLALAPAIGAETDVRAEIDRQEISVDETVTLSIIVNKMLFSGQPDPAPLQRDFRIINTQESSRTNIVNGEVDSSRQWDYILAPRREGELTIPALEVGKYRTNPITVTVNRAPERQDRGSDGFFIESDVTPRSAYLQSELAYTVKIYTAVNFLDANLEPPAIDDAIVETHDDRKYRTLIDGRYYQVIERNYSIFPQSSGTLTIPPLIFQARVEGYRSSLLDPGKLVVKRTRGHRVEVKPPPENFRGRGWLPARNLSIAEQWSDDPGQLTVGDSITRTLTVQADGVLGSQLPELPASPPSGAKLYPDQPKIDNRKREGRITGVRTESLAVLPTEPGEIVLPEIRIPWWNIETGRREVAVIPEARLSVKPAAAQSTGGGAQPERAAANRRAPSGAADTGTAVGGPLLWTLLTLNLLLLATSIAFAAAWYRNRRTAAAPPPAETRPPSEAKCFEALRDACRRGERADIRRRLLDWGHAFTGGTRPEGLHQLGSTLPELREHLAALDAELFHSGNGPPCDIDALLNAVQALRMEHRALKRRDGDDALAPLYPS